MTAAPHDWVVGVRRRIKELERATLIFDREVNSANFEQSDVQSAFDDVEESVEELRECVYKEDCLDSEYSTVTVFLKGGMTVQVSANEIGNFLHTNHEVIEARCFETRRPPTDYEEISK